MRTEHLLAAFTVGTALLALWAYLRWPSAAPTTMKGAIVRVLVALVLMQLGATLLHVGVEAAPALAAVTVIAVVVPALTYAFLASMWFLKVCADQLRGAS